MKMNMPVMEIIKFDSNDVIATSGNAHSNCFDYSGPYVDKNNPEAASYPNLYGCLENNDSGVVDYSTFYSDIETPKSGESYDYVNGHWVPCKHNH